jgi:ATP-dependent helicase HrpA
VVEQRCAGYTVQGYPALVDEGDSVAVRLLDNEKGQRSAMWAGTRRLLLLNLPPPAKFVQGRLSNEAKLALARHPHRDIGDLLDDCAAAAVDHLLADAGGPAWDAEGFDELLSRVRAGFGGTLVDTVSTVELVLTEAHRVRQRLAEAAGGSAIEPALADLREQLAGLVHRGFVTATGLSRLPDVVRYLRAMQWRLDRLAADPHKDRDRMLRVHQVQGEYRELVAAARDTAGAPDEACRALAEIRWMIEELRVSLFAQALGTRYPISEKRIYRAMDELPI